MPDTSSTPSEGSDSAPADSGRPSVDQSTSRSTSEKIFNPFYPLLVIVGVVFCVTACAYGVMTVRKLRNPLEEAPPAFIEWMDAEGFPLMMWELGALAALTFAAMATDSHYTNRAERLAAQRKSAQQPPSETQISRDVADPASGSETRSPDDSRNEQGE